MISGIFAKACLIRLKAAIATCASASVWSVYQPRSITGGIEMSGLVMVTLPRESGAASAAEMRPTLNPFVAVVVDVRYSLSGQSLSKSSKDLSAASEILLRNGGGTFSNATNPLSEEKGPAPSCRNCVKASASCRSLPWTGKSMDCERPKVGWS